MFHPSSYPEKQFLKMLVVSDLPFGVTGEPSGFKFQTRLQKRPTDVSLTQAEGPEGEIKLRLKGIRQNTYTNKRDGQQQEDFGK